MFVSRSEGCKPELVVIETADGIDGKVDKLTIPAALEFVIREVARARNRHQSEHPNVVLVALDRPPRDYEKAFKRLAVPLANVIDGFSQWYPVQGHTSESTARLLPKRNFVHIGACDPCSNKEGSLSGAVRSIVDSSLHRNSREYIIVIDSLTSVLRHHPELRTILSLRDDLAKSLVGRNGEHYVTLVSVLARRSNNTALLCSVRRIANTHILLSQGEVLAKHSSSGQNLGPGGSRDYVNMKVCKRKASGRVQIDYLRGRMDWTEKFLREVENTEEFSSGGDQQRAQKEFSQHQQAMLDNLGLSFRLSLSTAEKEVRAAAGLPYLHQDEDLADSALKLHPRALQLGGHPDDGSVDAEDEYSDEEELFSEDV